MIVLHVLLVVFVSAQSETLWEHDFMGVLKYLFSMDLHALDNVLYMLSYVLSLLADWVRG